MIGTFRLATADEIQGLFAEPLTITDFLDDEEDEAKSFDVDKAWHGIHYLLTGTAWEGDMPEGFILTGGQQIGEQDVGYGPARALLPDQLREVVNMMNALPVDALRKRFNPAEMRELEIYPSIWTRAPKDDDTLGYVLTHYDALKKFLGAAAERHLGVIIYLS